MIVTTIYSTYRLDREAMTAMRLTDAGGELRRDGEAIPMLQWPLEIEVGKPLRLELALRGDGVLTIRTTSLVLRVEP